MCEQVYRSSAALDRRALSGNGRGGFVQPAPLPQEMMRRFPSFSRAALASALLVSLTACVGYPAGPRYADQASPTYPAYPGSAYPAYPASSYPATASPAPPPPYVQYGRVSHIEYVRVAQPASGLGGTGIGAGAVVGGVLGGVLGNQVGKGSGRSLATIAGVVGGAVAGNAVEKNTQPEAYQDVVRVSVQLQDGSSRAFDYAQPPDLRVGEHVRVQNNQLVRDHR